MFPSGDGVAGDEEGGGGHAARPRVAIAARSFAVATAWASCSVRSRRRWAWPRRRASRAMRSPSWTAFPIRSAVLRPSGNTVMSPRSNATPWLSPERNVRISPTAAAVTLWRAVREVHSGRVEAGMWSGLLVRVVGVWVGAWGPYWGAASRSFTDANRGGVGVVSPTHDLWGGPRGQCSAPGVRGRLGKRRLRGHP